MNYTERVKIKKREKYLLLIANVFPLFAVIFLNWSVFELVFVYFSEIILFFLVNIVKVFFLKIPVGSKIVKSLLYLLFFSLFIAFIGAVLFLFYFAEIEKIYPNYSFNEVLAMIFNKSYFVNLALFLIVGIYNFVFLFIKKKEYLKHTVKTLIREPSIRIWILLIIAFTSIVIIKTNLSNSILVLIIFILLKIGVDLLFFKEKKQNVDIQKLYKE
ncbi:MAG: DUF6498-containing protein [Bacteroidota bacterium]|nr:DUF6498-containing protein [Bacteroidota bacterium]